MAGFGGSVKLTGESEYRKALQQCTQSLQSMSSALKTQTADFSSNDKSVKSTAAAQKQLNDTIQKQKQSIATAKSTLAGYSTEMQKQTTLHNQLNKEYKAAVIELDRIKKSSGTSSAMYKQFAEVVDKLGQELSDSAYKLDENKSAMASLKSEINNANKVIKNAETEIDNLGKEAEESGEQAKKGGEGFTVFKGILANLGSQAILSAINGLKNLGATFVSVGKQAINGYAEFEQLEGGVKKLFGDEAAQSVMENANKAFSSAGMSANQYMETVTSFSASLISGLNGDTQEAARISDIAIRDMSDNANTFGTDIQSIQNAYQGFAKGNFTMLDNLKLGYGGTQSEMARLINESGVLGDSMKVTAETVKDVPFDQMILAINKTQERMGIMGTTAKEASYTIEGSTNSMKAAWKNMLTGIADENANFEQLATNFIGTLITEDGKGGVLGQLIPRITTVITGISDAIATVLPQVIQSVVPLIEQNLPIIISAVEQALQTIVSVLPTIVDAIAPLIPQIVSMLLSMLPQIIDAGIKILLSLIDGITKALPDLMKMLPKIIKDVCNTLLDNLGLIIDAGIELIMALVDGLIEALPELIDYIPEIIDKVINAITENLPKLIQAGITLIIKLAEGLIKAIPQLVAKIPQIITSLVTGFGKFWSTIIGLGKDVIKNIVSGISDAVGDVLTKAGEVASDILDAFVEGLKGIFDIGVDLIKGLWEGIKSMGTWIKNKITGFGKGILNGLKSVFGIKSPSKVMRDQVGKYLAEGIGVGFTDEMKNVTQDMQNAIPTSFDTSLDTGINGTTGTMATNTYYDIVEAFKEALSDMDVVMDDEVMGKFIDKTVARTIYS